MSALRRPSRRVMRSTFSQDPCPIKLLPLLLEPIYSSIVASVPSTLPLDHIGLNIQHASNDLPGKEIALRPPHCVLHDMPQPTVHLKPHMKVRHFFDEAPPECQLSQSLFALSQSVDDLLVLRPFIF